MDKTIKWVTNNSFKLLLGCLVFYKNLDNNLWQTQQLSCENADVLSSLKAIAPLTSLILN